MTPWGAIAHILASLHQLEILASQIETRLDALEDAQAKETENKKPPVKAANDCKCDNFWCAKCWAPA